MSGLSSHDAVGLASRTWAASPAAYRLCDRSLPATNFSPVCQIARSQGPTGLR